jgi:hypothetical protein
VACGGGVSTTPPPPLQPAKSATRNKR